MNTDNDGYPIVIARRTKEGSQLTFYCDYCRTNHFHGLGGGHRGAHCHVPTSPYLKRGYVLKVED